MIDDCHTGANTVRVRPQCQSARNLHQYGLAAILFFRSERYTRRDRELAIDMREDDTLVLAHRHVLFDDALHQTSRSKRGILERMGCSVARIGWRWWRIGLEIVSDGVRHDRGDIGSRFVV